MGYVLLFILGLIIGLMVGWRTCLTILNLALYKLVDTYPLKYSNILDDIKSIREKA